MNRKLRFSTHTAIIALVAGCNAYAVKAADTDQIETVVVTGFRASLATSLEKKRNSALILESVTAEDFGKLPDQNVAESLQRLAGVQIDRTSGQGTKVRIRGLDQNETLLDGEVFVTGRELYATGEGAGGGGNQNTDSLEGIPSELLGGITVYKSPEASLVEGGLGGTIDLLTRSALDGPDGFTIGGNAKATHSEHTDQWTPAGAVVASYKFSNRLGVTASLSYDDFDTHEYEVQGANRGGWVLAGPTTGVDNTVGVDYIEPELLYYTSRDIERKRIGASLGVEFNPIEALSFDLNWFHSDLSVDDRDVNNKAWFHSNGLGLGIDPSKPYSIDKNGVVRNATFLTNGAETNTLVQETSIKSDDVQFKGNYDTGGEWRGSVKLAYARGQSNMNTASADQERSAYGINGNNGVFGNDATPDSPGCKAGIHCNSPIGFSYANGDGEVPEINYLAPWSDLLTNPAYGLFKSHWAFGSRAKNDQFSARADVQYDPAFITAIKTTFSGGVRYAQRDVDYVLGRYLLDEQGLGDVGNGDLAGPWGYFEDPGLPGVTPVETFMDNGVFGTLSAAERLAMFENFFPGSGMGNLLTQNPALMTDAAAWLHSLYPQYKEKFFVDPLNSFKVKESTDAGYVMADLGGPGDRLHVNVGTRIVVTHLNVTQNSPDPTLNPNNDGVRYWGTATWNGVYRDTSPLETSRTYTDVLPSANVVLDVADDQKLRMSAARVVARQNLFQLGSGFQKNFTRTFVLPNGDPYPDGWFQFTSGSKGNPLLDPYRATQFDMTYEYYFGKQGLINADVFYKSVDSFVVQETDSECIDNPSFIGGCSSGPVSAPHNGTGGKIQGVEIGAQYAMENGFGFNANYTFSESTSPTNSGFDSHLPIPGVSKHAYTVQAYYENYGFAGHVSYSWRSSSFNSLFGFPSNPDGSAKAYGVFNHDYGQVDAELSYQFTDNFGVVLEGFNLSNSHNATYLQFPNQPYTYDASGSRYSAGIRFSF